jgi:hypothetical protein
MSAGPPRPHTSHRPARETKRVLAHANSNSHEAPALLGVSRSLFSGSEQRGAGSSVRTRKGAGGSGDVSFLPAGGAASLAGPGAVAPLPVSTVSAGVEGRGWRSGSASGGDGGGGGRYSMWQALYLSLFLGDFRGDLVELATLVS